MKFFLSLFIVIAFLSCGRKVSDKPVTTVSLLNEMADLHRLANLPDDTYRSIQFSSYDRRSTRPPTAAGFQTKMALAMNRFPVSARF